MTTNALQHLLPVGCFAHLSEVDRKNIIKAMAYAAEASFRRGRVHGTLFGTLRDPNQWNKDVESKYGKSFESELINWRRDPSLRFEIEDDANYKKDRRHECAVDRIRSEYRGFMGASGLNKENYDQNKMVYQLDAAVVLCSDYDDGVALTEAVLKGWKQHPHAENHYYKGDDLKSKDDLISMFRAY